METNNTERQHNPSPEHPPKPPPIYIQDVTSIPLLLQLLEQVASHQYETKALANNQVKVKPATTDSYKAIIKAIAEKHTESPHPWLPPFHQTMTGRKTTTPEALAAHKNT
jgi:hypothetical protein